MKKLIVIGIVVLVTAYVIAPYQAMFMLIHSMVQGDSDRFDAHISWQEVEGTPETIVDAFFTSLGQQKMDYAMFESLTSFRLDVDNPKGPEHPKLTAHLAIRGQRWKVISIVSRDKVVGN